MQASTVARPPGKRPQVRGRPRVNGFVHPSPLSEVELAALTLASTRGRVISPSTRIVRLMGTSMALPRALTRAS
jgi:hypothetical protein